jgi:hypothetical protein
VKHRKNTVKHPQLTGEFTVSRRARSAALRAQESLHGRASKQMPLGKHAGIPMPYLEGLRIDEAMHPLTTIPNSQEITVSHWGGWNNLY